jgi:hypothetical protein
VEARLEVTVWNYRVVKTITGDEACWAIHECYYEKAGDAIPTGISEGAAAVLASRPASDSGWGGKDGAQAEMRRVFEMMTAALDRPVLARRRGEIVEEL